MRCSEKKNNRKDIVEIFPDDVDAVYENVFSFLLQ